jgi:hypothetical protein
MKDEFQTVWRWKGKVDNEGHERVEMLQRFALLYIVVRQLFMEKQLYLVPNMFSCKAW